MPPEVGRAMENLAARWRSERAFRGPERCRSPQNSGRGSHTLTHRRRRRHVTPPPKPPEKGKSLQPAGRLQSRPPPKPPEKGKQPRTPPPKPPEKGAETMEKWWRWRRRRSAQPRSSTASRTARASITSASLGAYGAPRPLRPSRRGKPQPTRPPEPRGAAESLQPKPRTKPPTTPKAARRRRRRCCNHSRISWCKRGCRIQRPQSCARVRLGDDHHHREPRPRAPPRAAPALFHTNPHSRRREGC